MRSLVLVLVVAGCGSEPRSLEASKPADPAAGPSPAPPAGLATPGAPLASRPAPGPATVPADPAVQLVAAASTTCAVLRSGAVACWGAPFEAPHRINGWNDVAKLAFTGGMLCALHRDDRVECGSLEAPELRGERATVAMQTLGGTQHAVDLAVSGDAVCVRETGGTVACWVAGGPPRMVRAGISQARALVMGGLLGPEWQFPLVSYACALVDGGRVACFDVYRQARQNPSDPRKPADEYLAVAGKTPALHLGRPRIHKLISGATELQEPQRPDAPVCAASGGAPRCFRLGEHAVPGDLVEPGEPPCTRSGESLTCALQVGMAPRMTVPLARERQVAVGSSHACAITEPGGVVCWGDDTYAALGRGVVAQDPLAPVLGVHDAIDVVTWTYGAVALRANGQLAYWGHGDAGDPAQTDLPITLSSITDAERIVAGHFHVCVLRRGGRVACWGAMSARSFGRHAPAEIAALHGVTALGATDFGIVARVADGSLVHLGDPQLGATAAETPAPVAGAAHAAAIVVAGQWICILDRAPGAVRCRAETRRWSTPELVVGGLADVVEVAGTGPAFPEATPDALTAAGDPELRYPTAKLVARLADGRAFEVALGIDQGRPRATVSALATATTSVFASSYEVCARGAQAVSCAGADRFPAPAIPSELAGARRLSLGNPRCAVRADGQVVCFAGDLFSRGTGLGLADVPVPVAL